MNHGPDGGFGGGLLTIMLGSLIGSITGLLVIRTYRLPQSYGLPFVSFLVIAAVSLLVLGATGAQAQENADPAEGARFHLGPLRFTPSLATLSYGTLSTPEMRSWV